MAVLNMVKNFRIGVTFPSLGQIIFYWLTTIYFCFFLRMSSQWPALRDEWKRMEAFMGGLPPVQTSSKVAAVTVFYTAGALLEHTLSILEFMNLCSGEGDIFEMFLRSSFSDMTAWTQFSVWKAILLLTFNLIYAILWNFVDIFIITISLALSARLKQLYLSLERVMNQDMTEDFWRQSRQRYSKISALTRHLNDKLSLIILLTFGNNLYSVCLMLLRTFMSHAAPIQIVYYITSFALVLLRLFGICIAAARISEISKAMLPILFAVSSNSYNSEVQRFILQVKDDELSLSACRFFRVTRSLLLNVVGMIVTYEVVLFQYNALNTETHKQQKPFQCPT